MRSRKTLEILTKRLDYIMFRTRIKLNFFYELWNNKKPTVKYFIVFESSCHILRDWKNLHEFDNK